MVVGYSPSSPSFFAMTDTNWGWAHPAEFELIHAVSSRNHIQAERALRRGASADTCDHRGQPLLHLAMAQGQVNMVQTLLEAGADLSRLDNRMRSGHELLRQSGIGCLLNIPSRQGTTSQPSPRR